MAEWQLVIKQVWVGIGCAFALMAVVWLALIAARRIRRACIKAINRGLSDDPVCHNCGAPPPTSWYPRSLRQVMWGGWSCTNCDCELDDFGRVRRRNTSQHTKEKPLFQPAPWLARQFPELELFESSDARDAAWWEVCRKNMVRDMLAYVISLGLLKSLFMGLFVTVGVRNCGPGARLVCAAIVAIGSFGGAMLVPWFLSQRRTRRILRRRLHSRGVQVCSKCGYCLTGLAGDICPECGGSRSVESST
jgi:hypothetical protein